MAPLEALPEVVPLEPLPLDPVDVGVELAAAAGVVFLLILINCSSELNWANCETNCVLSAGLSGSWFFNCATSKVKNSFSFGLPLSGSVEAELLVLEDELEL